MSGRPIRTEGRETSRAAAVWLAAVAALILAMVIVGGATRATGSGLSITQWKPVSGVTPPLSPQDWERLFALYKAIPQYRLVNPDMNLAAFKGIFWWEWSHRMLGRLLGVVFLVPFVVLLLRRGIPRRLIGRCVGLFFLGGLQGAVGWWMVESGLEFRTSVAPERLAVHLALALALFAACVWTALDAWFGPPALAGRRRLAWASGLFLAAVYLQCLLGALVAGNHAGLANADWPMMSGKVFPTDYWQGGVWTSLVHGLAATQFNHRLLAYGLLAGGIAQVTAYRRGPNRAATALASAILAALMVQIALGVATLVLTVPMTLALAHQFTAAVILALATALAWNERRPSPVL
ncbi:MAG TPA: COX15/CtaA family protein [Caulobacteraceae bacterium]|jgi:cytochrome c oxidase assembly protein subunit 15